MASSDEEGISKSSQYYGELFPPLSTGGHSPPSASQAKSNASKSAGTKLKSKNITQSLTIPLQKCSFTNFGTRDQTMNDACKLVRTETGCQLEVYSDREEIRIMITGLAENVKQARKRLTYELESKETVQVHVPKDLHKHILGKKGQKLIDIQRETGTKITVPRADNESEMVNISGPKDNLLTAQQRLSDIIQDRANKNILYLPFPRELVPFLQKEGDTIRDQFDVNLSYPSRNSESSEVKLTGENRMLDAAKEWINKFSLQQQASITTVKANIPKSKYKYIIGKDGRNVREIMNNFNVSVEIPAKDDGDEHVVLRGPRDKINEALKDIEKKMNSFLETVLKAPPWSHRYFIGHKGEELANLKSEFPDVNVEFPRVKTELGRSDEEGMKEDEIKIRGDPQQVIRVKERIEQLLKDILLTLTHEEIKLNNKCIVSRNTKRPALTGLLKSAVYKARASGIAVRFMADKNQLLLDGDIDRVHQTKEDLLKRIAQVEKSKERDLVVAYFLHPLVRGEPHEADSTRAVERNHGVRIKFFGIEDDPSEVIRISGEIESVDVAYKELKLKVKRLQEDTVSRDVKLYEEFHDHLENGAGRRELQRIKEETHSRIQLFRENHVAILVGTERDILKAEQLLIQAQDKFLDTVTESLNIPSQLHRVIIGQKGKQVQALEAEFGGVKIHMPSLDERQAADEKFNPDLVTVTGPSKSVAKAADKIKEIASKPENCFEEVKISPQHMAYFRSYRRAGVMLHDLREEFNVRTFLPARYDRTLSEHDKKLITLIGGSKQVVQAKKELENIISGLEKEVREMESMPQSYRRNFFKHKAELLIDLEEDFDVKISLSKGEGEFCDITVDGPKIFVDSCLAEIRELIQAWDDEVTREETVEPTYLPRIRGRGNQNLFTLEEEFNVEIKVVTPSNAPAVLVVTGAPSQVDQAMGALLSYVPVEREIDIPPRFVLVMKSGEVQDLEQKYSVRIDLPRRGSTGMTYVQGPAEPVEEVMKELSERVERWIQEEDEEASRNFYLEIDIPKEFHPRIMGRGGAFRKQIEGDFGVSLKFPSQMSDETSVGVVGVQENTERAQGFIQDQVVTS